jgi:hypothetical protein
MDVVSVGGKAAHVVLDTSQEPCDVGKKVYVPELQHGIDIPSSALLIVWEGGVEFAMILMGVSVVGWVAAAPSGEGPPFVLEPSVYTNFACSKLEHLMWG